MIQSLARSLIILTLLYCLRGSAGAAEARRLADLNPGPVGSYPSNLTWYAGKVYFSAYTLATGVELWRYDGNTITLAADINDTSDDIGSGVQEGNDSLPAWLTEFNGHLYFSAFEPRRGGELWRFDGTQASRVTDINADANDTIKFVQNSSWPYGLIVFSNALYFSATSNTMPENYEFWKVDATGVQQAANLHPDVGTNHSSYPTEITLFNGSLYFSADNGANGWELWQHTGTETKLIDINPGSSDSSSYPKHFTVFENQLYFQAYHGESGFELWRTDGTTTELVEDLAPGVESSYPEYMVPFAGALYFRGTDALTGSELRKFDGAAITLAADVNPAGDSSPKNLFVLGDKLLFAANDGTHGWELWAFDGTNASMVIDLNPLGDAFPENFTTNGNLLYFTATTPDTGYELWKYDGQTVTLAAEVNPGAGDSFPRFLTALNGELFFSAAEDGFSNWELWTLGTETTNQPPVITIVSPENGTTVQAGESLTIEAEASDDSGVAMVEFFGNDVSLGSVIEPPYSLVTTLSAGSHSLTAKATDSSGAVTVSAPVLVTVTEPPAGQPLISAVSRTGESTVISVTNSVDRAHTLEASPDLSAWTEVETKTASGGSVSFTHETNATQQYYRVLIR